MLSRNSRSVALSFVVAGCVVLQSAAQAETVLVCERAGQAQRSYSATQVFEAEYPADFRIAWLPGLVVRDGAMGFVELPRLRFGSQDFHRSDDPALGLRSFVGPVSEWPFSDESRFQTPGQTPISLETYVGTLGIDGVYVTVRNTASGRASSVQLMEGANGLFLMAATLADGTVRGTEFVRLLADCRTER